MRSGTELVGPRSWSTRGVAAVVATCTPPKRFCRASAASSRRFFISAISWIVTCCMSASSEQRRMPDGCGEEQEQAEKRIHMPLGEASKRGGDKRHIDSCHGWVASVADSFGGVTRCAWPTSASCIVPTIGVENQGKDMCSPLRSLAWRRGSGRPKQLPRRWVSRAGLRSSPSPRPLIEKRCCFPKGFASILTLPPDNSKSKTCLVSSGKGTEDFLLFCFSYTDFEGVWNRGSNKTSPYVKDNFWSLPESRSSVCPTPTPTHGSVAGAQDSIARGVGVG